ncbi:hypothetical protein V8E55_007930 [Tylopilus felleus]
MRFTSFNLYAPEIKNTSALKHLRKLELILLNAIFLDYIELDELCRNWPMLEVLVLTCIRGCSATSVTLGGLLSLLTHCPRLREPSLSLDAREVLETMSVDVRHTTLTCTRRHRSTMRV